MDKLVRILALILRRIYLYDRFGQDLGSPTGEFLNRRVLFVIILNHFFTVA